MTENEIIKMLEVEKAYMDSHGGRSQSEALAYAIESVKEIQRYIEIGTVEELIKTQIREKVLNVELESYKEIGTIEEFKALKEKSVAKKPIRIDECTCPSCGTHNEIIKKRRNTVAFDTVYCWHCGQAIEIKRD